MQNKIDESKKILDKLKEMQSKSTKLETLDSNNNDANSVKKFIKEINGALDGLNTIGAISLSNENFNCDKIELPADLIIGSQKANKTKKIEEKVTEKKIQIIEKPTTRRNQTTPNKVQSKTETKKKLQKEAVISEDEESQQTKPTILTELSEDYNI